MLRHILVFFQEILKIYQNVTTKIFTCFLKLENQKSTLLGGFFHQLVFQPFGPRGVFKKNTSLAKLAIHFYDQSFRRKAIFSFLWKWNLKLSHLIRIPWNITTAKFSQKVFFLRNFRQFCLWRYFTKKLPAKKEKKIS